MAHPVTERLQVLAAGDAAWTELLARLDAAPENTRVHIDEIGWTARDVFTHLARWQVRSIEQLLRLTAGNPALPPLPGTDDEINARWVEQDRALTVQEARAWCIQSANDLRRLLLLLSPEQWEAFGRDQAVDVDGRHYGEHAAFFDANAKTNTPA